MKGIFSDIYPNPLRRYRASPLSTKKRPARPLNLSAKRSKSLWKITSLLSSAKDLHEAAQIIVDEGFRSVGAQNGDISLVDLNGRYDVLAVKGYPKNFLKKWLPIPKNTPLLTTKVIKSKQPMFIRDINEIENKYKVAKSFMHSSGTISASILPLVSKGKIIGILQFTFKKLQDFNQEDKLFLITLANQCALAFDRVLSQSQLQASKDQLEAILRSSANGIIAQNTKGKIVYINDVAASLMGYADAEQLKGRSSTLLWKRVDLFDEDDQPLPSPLSLSEMQTYETLNKDQTYKFISKKGKDVSWITVKQSIINDRTDNSMLLLQVFNDITPIKELDKRKDEFISLASHELRTPLTSLRLFLELLANHLKAGSDKKGISYSTKAIQLSSRLSKLIGELLDISRIQKGKLTIQTEVFRLDELLMTTASDLQLINPTHPLVLDNLPELRVTADEFRIYQVVTNLVNNAVKHSDQGKKVIISLKKIANTARVSIMDFGTGIPKNKQKRIFDQFYQVTGGSSKKVTGLGIGLFIAQEIITTHGGEMWVKSQVGKGSTFYFTLPLAK